MLLDGYWSAALTGLAINCIPFFYDGLCPSLIDLALTGLLKHIRLNSMTVPLRLFITKHLSIFLEYTSFHKIVQYTSLQRQLQYVLKNAR